MGTFRDSQLVALETTERVLASLALMDERDRAIDGRCAPALTPGLVATAAGGETGGRSYQIPPLGVGRSAFPDDNRCHRKGIRRRGAAALDRRSKLAKLSLPHFRNGPATTGPFAFCDAAGLPHTGVRIVVRRLYRQALDVWLGPARGNLPVRCRVTIPISGVSSSWRRLTGLSRVSTSAIRFSTRSC